MRRLVLMCLLLTLLAPCADAVQIPLSKFASDGVNPPTADLLDAIFDFTVDGTTLTLAVTNLTPENTGDPALKINEIYFNAMDNITGLTLTEVIGANKNQWALGFVQGGGLEGEGNPHQVNGFGKFDVYIVDGQGTLPHVIDPGETITFVMSITGTAPIVGNFIELSTQVDGHQLCTIAAKFYNGVPEMSAYGGTDVPEPTTVCLLGLGGLALLSRKRRV